MVCVCRMAIKDTVGWSMCNQDVDVLGDCRVELRSIRRRAQTARAWSRNGIGTKASAWNRGCGGANSQPGTHALHNAHIAVETEHRLDGGSTFVFRPLKSDH